MTDTLIDTPYRHPERTEEQRRADELMAAHVRELRERIAAGQVVRVTCDGRTLATYIPDPTSTFGFRVKELLW